MIRPLVGLAAAALVAFAAAPAFAQSALSNCKYYTKTQQDFAQGLPYCEKCIEDEPDNPEARYYGAWCLAETGSYEEAWPSFAWLIERSNDKDKKVRKHAKWANERVQAYFARHFNKGVEYLNANDLVSAREEFLQATQIAPIKVEGFLNLGYVQNQLEAMDGALRSFRSAIEVDPQRAVSYEYYSVALAKKRDALRAFEPPDSAAIAEVTVELESTLKTVIENEPSNDAALVQLGDLTLERGDTEAGIAFIEKAIEISPENVVKLYNIAVGFYQRKNFPMAAQTFGMVAGHLDDPEDDLWKDAMYNRGLALKETKGYEDALACAQKLIEADETEPDYHNLASGLYVALKDLKKAAEHADRAEQLKSQRIEGASGSTP